jgi:maleylpyruvate isomerase
MLKLHGYWRSGAAYRVRIALALKGLEYAHVAHDLRAGAQRDPAYLEMAPQGLVPALDTGQGQVLTQSGAIIEWLDERYPAPPLLPPDLDGRAVVRAMAALIACDIHPLNNLRVLQALEHDFGASPDARKTWIRRWVGDGFTALETLITRAGGDFAYGDTPGMVECFLVPQVYSARRFGVDLSPWPLVVAVSTRAEALPQVAAAHPDRQPDKS